MQEYGVSYDNNAQLHKLFYYKQRKTYAILIKIHGSQVFLSNWEFLINPPDPCALQTHNVL